MKAKRKVITTPGVRPAKRTPTVRRVRSAIVPVPRDRRPGDPGRERPPRVDPATAVASTSDELEAARPVDLSVDLAPTRRGLRLAVPVIAAAGPYGFGVEVAGLVDIGRVGAIVTRSVTLRQRTGNPAPRMASVPAGQLNAVGLQGPGVEAIVERYAPTWAEWSTPVVVSLAAGSVGDYAALARRLDGVPGVAGLELNLSCPGGRGGRLFAADPEGAAAVTAAVRRATELPLIAKLSAVAPDPRSVAAAVVEAGADAVSAIDTVPGLALDEDRTGPAVATGYGGLSGPVIRPIAMRVVYEVAPAVDVPVVGVGGVASLDDVLDLLAVGAAAVGVATAALADPGLPVRLADELADECRRRGLDEYRSLVGTALPARTPAPAIRGVEYRP